MEGLPSATGEGEHRGSRMEGLACATFWKTSPMEGLPSATFWENARMERLPSATRWAKLGVP